MLGSSSSAEDVSIAVKKDDADRDVCEARGKAGRRHVERTYRWDDVTDGYEGLIRSWRGFQVRDDTFFSGGS